MGNDSGAGEGSANGETRGVVTWRMIEQCLKTCISTSSRIQLAERARRMEKENKKESENRAAITTRRETALGPTTMLQRNEVGWRKEGHKNR